jgi:hypothetical protein
VLIVTTVIIMACYFNEINLHGFLYGLRQHIGTNMLLLTTHQVKHMEDSLMLMANGFPISHNLSINAHNTLTFADMIEAQVEVSTKNVQSYQILGSNLVHLGQSFKGANDDIIALNVAVYHNIQAIRHHFDVFRGRIYSASMLFNDLSKYLENSMDNIDNRLYEIEQQVASVQSSLTNVDAMWHEANQVTQKEYHIAKLRQNELMWLENEVSKPEKKAGWIATMFCGEPAVTMFASKMEAWYTERNIMMLKSLLFMLEEMAPGLLKVEGEISKLYLDVQMIRKGLSKL